MIRTYQVCLAVVYRVCRKAAPHLFFLLCCAVAGFAQTADEQIITIAVLDLRSTGGLSDENVNTVNSYLQGRIAELPNFRMLERQQLEEVIQQFEEQQLTGTFDITDQTDLALIDAQQLIVGSIGKIFDRVTISIRLVEIRSAEVVFASTIHAPEDQILNRIDEIVQRVNEFGLLRFQRITLDDVEQLVRRRRWAEAQDRLEQFFLQERREQRTVPSSEQLVSLRERISENLYRDYLRQARTLRRRRDFDQARRMINRAIALQPTSEALEERDRIIIEQDAYERERETRLRLIELRAQEEQERAMAGAFVRPSDAIRFYFQQIRSSALRLSVVQAILVDEELTLPSQIWGLTGAQYNQTFSFFSASEPRFVETTSLASVSAGLIYNDSENQTSIDAYFSVSPHTAVALKTLNLVTTVGIDGGVLLRSGPLISDGYAWYPTTGIVAIADFMIYESYGLHAGMRVDHIFQSQAVFASPWIIRFFSGISL